MSKTKIGIISGYFNPLHRGHIDYIRGAKIKCDLLVVIVNNDYQVTLKNSIPFMNEEDRVEILRSIRCVDIVALSTDRDGSVINTLKELKEEYNEYDVVFMNGGNKTAKNIPEYEFCKENDIEMLFGVGGTKTRSSSQLIKNARLKRKSELETQYPKVADV